MKKMMLILAVLFLSASATSAFAKDLCVGDSIGGSLKFDNVRLLKGKTTPLVGRYNFGNGPLNTPVHGAVTVDSDNVETRVILTYSNVFLNEIAIFTMVGDKSFNATGNYDIVPFGSIDFTTTWVSIPCATVQPASVSRTPAGSEPSLGK